MSKENGKPNDGASPEHTFKVALETSRAAASSSKSPSGAASSEAEKRRAETEKDVDIPAARPPSSEPRSSRDR
jgi:hypothetical protein